MALKKWDPLKDILFLQEQMSRMFDEALMKYRSGLGGACAPPVDIYETGTHIVLKAELPGLEIEDVSIEVEDSTLVLKGERKLDERREHDYHRMERFYGTFQRSFCLPEAIDAAAIKAGLKDGVLEITIPKVEPTGGGEVKIKVE